MGFTAAALSPVHPGRRCRRRRRPHCVNIDNVDCNVSVLLEPVREIGVRCVLTLMSSNCCLSNLGEKMKRERRLNNKFGKMWHVLSFIRHKIRERQNVFRVNIILRRDIQVRGNKLPVISGGRPCCKTCERAPAHFLPSIPRNARNFPHNVPFPNRAAKRREMQIEEDGESALSAKEFAREERERKESSHRKVGENYCLQYNVGKPSEVLQYMHTHIQEKRRKIVIAPSQPFSSPMHENNTKLFPPFPQILAFGKGEIGPSKLFQIVGKMYADRKPSLPAFPVSASRSLEMR